MKPRKSPSKLARPKQAVLRTTEDQAAANAGKAGDCRCPHCDSSRTVHWGSAHGLPRYRCMSCRHTFNVLTKTTLARLRNKARWLTYVGTMVEKKSVRESASTCGVSASTAYRWRHRFLDCPPEQRAKILIAMIGTQPHAAKLAGASKAASVESLNGADLSGYMDLLPVLLSWLI